MPGLTCIQHKQAVVPSVDHMHLLPRQECDIISITFANDSDTQEEGSVVVTSSHVMSCLLPPPKKKVTQLRNIEAAPAQEQAAIAKKTAPPAEKQASPQKETSTPSPKEPAAPARKQSFLRETITLLSIYRVETARLIRMSEWKEAWDSYSHIERHSVGGDIACLF